MNTASRIESTSQRNRIQISKATADLLRAANKESWLTKREDKVNARGLGELETYWLNVKRERAGSVASHTPSNSTDSNKNTAREKIKAVPSTSVNEKKCRLIDWNVEILLRLMKQVVAQRGCMKAQKDGRRDPSEDCLEVKETPFEEVREIIALPEFDSKGCGKQQKTPKDILIPDIVTGELYSLVRQIAEKYNDNPFHNFDHASVSKEILLMYMFLLLLLVYTFLLLLKLTIHTSLFLSMNLYSTLL